MNDAETRTVIVTGAGGGIGRAISLALAARGCRLVLADLDEERAHETCDLVDGEALAVRCDVTDDDDVAKAFAVARDEFGQVHGVCNNAAYQGVVSPLADYPLDVFDRVQAVNVRGVFLCLRHAIRAMAEKGGSIVNIASQAGLRGNGMLSAYSASKHAVVGLAASATLEVSRQGIVITTICPGPVDTDMIHTIERGLAERGADPKGFREQVPLGRYGDPQEVAALAAWLLTEAPAYMAGSVISIDGGMTRA
jgi:NAD(P)-dependent dehydrogenase (short-subunit alcohol dehydrogenase family)